MGPKHNSCHKKIIILNLTLTLILTLTIILEPDTSPSPARKHNRYHNFHINAQPKILDSNPQNNFIQKLMLHLTLTLSIPIPPPRRPHNLGYPQLTIVLNFNVHPTLTLKPNLNANLNLILPVQLTQNQALTLILPSKPNTSA